VAVQGEVTGVVATGSGRAGGSAEPAGLLALAVRLAREAAGVASAMRSAAITDIATKTTRTDVVTAADVAVERYVGAALRRLRPGDSLLGEEAGERAGTRAGGAGTVRWILDPIDGTVNYLYGLPQWAVSLAVEVDGQVVAGVVRNGVTGQEWTALRGHGAYHRGRPVRGSGVTELGQALVATGFGYAPDRRAYQARVLAGLLPAVRDIRRLGSAALDLCLAAQGRVDAYFEKGLNLWDHAAGALVAAEAGLRVTGLAGAAPGPELVLAAPAGIHRQLHDLLVALEAAGGP